MSKENFSSNSPAPLRVSASDFPLEVFEYLWIAEKIGEGERPGTVFKSRKIIGHTSQPEFADAKITTRILWLEGLESGVNRGGNVDSHARYIYIHGTADQTTIGKPASCGCIHLADADLIPLFDKLPSGTLVWIHA